MLLALFLLLFHRFGLIKSTEEPCVTVSGEDPSKPCVFPFVQEGVTYNECAWYGGYAAWCSTRNNANNVTLRRGNCAATCPIPEKPCMAVIDEMYSGPCVFPFVYMGVTHNTCLWDGQNFVHWCSTLNDNKSETVMRGNCGSGCPIPEDEKCLTVLGEKCIFPFKFNDVTYYECTWDYSNTPWCSTKVDPSGAEIYSKDHDSSIFRQSYNPVCGFSVLKQVRLCAVLPTENWLGSSTNHIQT